MSRACLLLCLAAGAVNNLSAKNLETTEFSVPMAVKVGETALLQCRHAAYARPVIVKWWRRPLPGGGGGAGTVQLYQRIAGRAAEILRRHIAIKDQDSIELLHMHPRDSGVYECEVGDRDELTYEWRRKQELVVYTPGHGVALNVSKVPDGPDADEDARVECEAQGVAPEPELLLIIDGVQQAVMPVASGPTDGLYDIAANATVSRHTVDGKQVRCELIYKNKNITLATNERNIAIINEFDWSADGSSALSRSWPLALAAVATHLRLRPLL